MDPTHRRGKPSDLSSFSLNARDARSGPTHHFSDSVEPQTPLGAPSPVRTGFPTPEARKLRVSPLLRWAVEPAAALPILLVPVVLFLNWELLAPHLAHFFGHDLPPANPFAPLLLLSHGVPGPQPRYARGRGDIAFVVYYIVLFSFVRQVITVRAGRRVGRFFGLTRAGKLERFGEQGYAFLYFLVFGAWGVRIMGQLPTWWYRTDYFWIDFPHTAMLPELKAYYLLQTAYWVQQFFVLVLGLEKPRKDYAELVAHHLVTLFLVVLSYLMNLTLIGSAVYMSMDIPDALLALSKLLNYIQWDRTNNFVLAAFVGAWTYFRHYLNLVILHSVYADLDAQLPAGTHLAPAVRWGAFAALCLLQALNLFWYYLIIRIAVKLVLTSKAEDVRSDDEDDGGDEEDEKEDGDGR
ncbi:TLC domain-containing protein [Mycena rosella]|uniref:TLC domain-containing protein n=1 Tax=Mycena rosella TaxID=1033263 RepID=A0AAD7G4H2_MYCRO|nr:TLC domain-containing protein [Mycena rosella]